MLNPLKSIVFVLGLFFCSQLNAQRFTISGSLVNKSGDPMIGANIQLFSDPGNKQIAATTAGKGGNFIIKDLPAGNYRLKISYLGYIDLIKAVRLDKDLFLGKLIVKEENIVIKGTEIKAEAPSTVVKGDTTEMNAKAYKVNPDATSEDLVTKMPGVTLENGTVKAQGEKVQKVLVDGKQFYGDDPSAALKNLPAEVIDKVQIFDKKSDQSDFTGFDDGNTTKTMNIITKQSYQNGKFGKFLAGAGYKDVWKAGGIYNVFKGDRRFSILTQSNNINDQNFSVDDFTGSLNASSGFGNSGPRGGGPPRSSGGGGSPSLSNNNNGITKTNAIGLNFNDKWKVVDFSASYFVNYTDNTTVNQLLRQYFTSPDIGLNYAENSQSNTYNYNHRVNFRIDYQLDSMNSLLFQPRFSLQHTRKSAAQLGENKLADILLSNSNNNSLLNSDGINFSSPILLRHKFQKRGRTLSLSLNPSYNNTQGKSTLNTLSNFFNDTLASHDSVEQSGNSLKYSSSISSNLNYTEPLAKNTQLQIGYGVTNSQSSSDKKIHDLISPGDIEILDTALSNVFKTKYLFQSGGLSLRQKTDKMNFMAGCNYQQTQLKNDQSYPEIYLLNKTFNAFLPNLMLQYRFDKQKSLRLNFNTSFNIPSVDQLQNVINNNNPLQLTSGNPELRPENQKSLNLRYSAANTDKLKSFFLFLNASYTNNYIGNSSIIADKDTIIDEFISLSKGSQLSRPVNFTGNYNLRSFANYSFQIKFLSSKLNLNTSVTYSHTPGMINSNINYSNVLSSGFGVVLSSNISEKVDFTVASTSTYNHSTNSSRANLNADYFQQNSRVRLNLMPWKGVVLQTDLNHFYYTASGSSSIQRSLLWNAALAYKFLAKKQAEFRFSVYDILGQNKDINRNWTDTYYEDSRNNILQRYYMLTFTYTIRSGNMPASDREGGRDRGFRPPHD